MREWIQGVNAILGPMEHTACFYWVGGGRVWSKLIKAIHLALPFLSNCNHYVYQLVSVIWVYIPFKQIQMDFVNAFKNAQK